MVSISMLTMWSLIIIHSHANTQKIAAFTWRKSDHGVHDFCTKSKDFFSFANSCCSCLNCILLLKLRDHDSHNLHRQKIWKFTQIVGSWRSWFSCTQTENLKVLSRLCDHGAHEFYFNLRDILSNGLLMILMHTDRKFESFLSRLCDHGAHEFYFNLGDILSNGLLMILMQTDRKFESSFRTVWSWCSCILL